MRNLALLALAALLALPAAAPPATAAPPPRSARDVVVRGGEDLADLLTRATRDAWADAESARPVAVVVDVTPHTAAAGERLAAALEAVGDEIRHLSGDWRIGALGRKLSDGVRHPSALVPKVRGVLAEETPEASTLRALRRTLAGFPDRGGVVVYLADWRFEDDDDLEGLIGKLRGRGQSLRVIGSEGCFGRAWNDGLPRFAIGDAEPDPNVGRNPFGPRKADAPWHGGDTAYPHAPYSFGSLPWQTEFVPDSLRDLADPGSLEDLRERMGRMKAGGGGMKRYPLASSFGPYALTRAAAETGGHYYLLSWNPEGRVDVVYDYGKCNLFEPDLRPRREILADVRSDPIPATMVRVWRKLADPSLGIVSVTPPFTPSGAPDEIDRVPAGQGLATSWPQKADLELFLARVTKSIRALDRAVRDLERVLSAPARTGAPWPRYRADAKLLLHTLRVLRFELEEAKAAAETVPDDAWDDENMIPAIDDVEWIRPGGDPARIRTTDARPFREEAGEEIRADRQRHLEAFGGTPFGETVARNPVVTWRFRKLPSLRGMASGDLGRTPSESGRDGAETPPDRGGATGPGGGSSGGGPASGR